METHLWHKIRRRRSKAGRKGFSSVVGAIFMTVIVWILASSYFVWTLSQNTMYNEVIREKDQLESDIQSEDLQVTNTTYVVTINDNVLVSAKIKNTGSLGVQFITLWAHASNETYDGYNYTQLSNVNVQGGATLSLNVNVLVKYVKPPGNYSFASWLITARGNVVPLQEYIFDLITVSQTTQGIGALMMDFEDFTYYNISQTGPPYILKGYPDGGSGYYVQGAKGPPVGQFAFEVVITNLDKDKRDIILNAPSVLFSIFPTTTSAFQGTGWYIVNVDGTGAIASSYAPVTLAYRVPTALYFASSYSGTYTPFKQATFTGTCPVNLALIGTIGGSPFGQNIPFVSIYISP